MTRSARTGEEPPENDCCLTPFLLFSQQQYRTLSGPCPSQPVGVFCTRACSFSRWILPVPARGRATPNSIARIGLRRNALFEAHPGAFVSSDRLRHPLS